MEYNFLCILDLLPQRLYASIKEGGRWRADGPGDVTTFVVCIAYVYNRQTFIYWLSQSLASPQMSGWTLCSQEGGEFLAILLDR